MKRPSCWRMPFLSASVLLMMTTPFQAQQTEPTVPKVVRIEYEMRKVALPSTLSESELVGRKLWAQRCAVCHDWPRGNPLSGGAGRGGPLGPWVDQETIKRVGEANVRTKIATGSRQMPGFQYNLQPIQVDQIVAYLNTVTPDRRPKPAPRTGSQ